MKRGIKHRHQPGDISKGAKIDLFEKEGKYNALGRRSVEPSRLRGRRSYIKAVLLKERAVLTERFRREITNLE
jgi:hypothetical protein